MPLPKTSEMPKIFNEDTINWAIVAVEIQAQSFLPMIEKIFNQLLITMIAIVEIEPNAPC